MTLRFMLSLLQILNKNKFKKWELIYIIHCHRGAYFNSTSYFAQNHIVMFRSQSFSFSWVNSSHAFLFKYISRFYIFNYINRPLIYLKYLVFFFGFLNY